MIGGCPGNLRFSDPAPNLVTILSKNLGLGKSDGVDKILLGFNLYPLILRMGCDKVN